jgi:hypothetical protein
MAISKPPYIRTLTENRVILGIDHGRRRWEVLIDIDHGIFGGITTEIVRDGICCTTTEFGWKDRHENEEVAP